MAWVDYDLSGVNPNLEPVAAGKYDFKLLGATVEGDDEGSRLVISASVKSDGDFTGRKVRHAFFPGSYTDKQLKRLEIALANEAFPGEGNVEYLNRVAASGGTFNAEVVHKPNSRDASNPYIQFNPWSFAPAL